MTSFHGRQRRRLTVTPIRKRGWWKRRAVVTRPILWGWLLAVLHSRLAPFVSDFLAAAAVVFASLPDGGVEVSPWVFFPGIVALFALSVAARYTVEGTRVAAYARTSSNLGGIISSLAGHAGGGQPKILQRPERAVDILLRRARELAETWLRVPVGTAISAHLLVPVPDEKGTPIGLIATTTDDYQPDRRHEIIPLDAPGAGRAFCTGVACAVPSTKEETHPRLQGTTYQSVGAFPICVGEPASGGRIVAVLSLDSSAEYTFDEDAVKQLAPFVAPFAQLIGLALELRKQGE